MRLRRALTSRRWLPPALAALVARVSFFVVTAMTLAIFHPRRNPGAELWVDQLNAHTLAEHVARSGERGNADRYLGRGDAAGTDAASPLYRALIDAGELAGAPGWAVGTLVSIIAIVAAAVLLHRCLQLEAPRWFDQGAALRATWLWLLFPTAALLGWIAPWALVGALIGGSWLAALHGHRLTAGALAGFAIAAHPIGVSAVPLVLLATRADHAGNSDEAPTEPASAAADHNAGTADHNLGTADHGPVPADRHRAAADQDLATAAPWRTPRAWAGAVLAVALPAVVHLADAGRDATVRRIAALQSPLSGATGTVRDATAAVRDTFTTEASLRIAPSEPYGDAVSEGMLVLLGTGSVVVLITAAIAAVLWRAPAIAASCGVAALALLMAPPGELRLLGAHVLLACVLPLFAVLGRVARAPDLTYRFVLASFAALFGTFATGSALWQWLV